MPDIVNRSTFEEDLATAIARLFGRQRREVIALLGDPPNMASIPPEWWVGITTELRSTIAPIMEVVYLEQAAVVMDVATIGVEWGLVNEAAVTWANNYTLELVAGLNNTTRQAVTSAVNSFFSQGLSITELKAKLTPIFGPVRAELIAVTEVTRAAAEGERQTAARIARNTGVDMVPIWQTVADERVCPICGPRHDQVIIDGQFPPAHPRCRCFVTLELPPVPDEIQPILQGALT